MNASTLWLGFGGAKVALRVFFKLEGLAGAETANVENGLYKGGNFLGQLAGDVKIDQGCDQRGVFLEGTFNDFDAGHRGENVMFSDYP